MRIGCNKISKDLEDYVQILLVHINLRIQDICFLNFTYDIPSPRRLCRHPSPNGRGEVARTFFEGNGVRGNGKKPTIFLQNLIVPVDFHASTAP
jgi:hypothetical protein